MTKREMAVEILQGTTLCGVSERNFENVVKRTSKKRVETLHELFKSGTMGALQCIALLYGNTRIYS